MLQFRITTALNNKAKRHIDGTKGISCPIAVRKVSGIFLFQDSAQPYTASESIRLEFISPDFLASYIKSFVRRQISISKKNSTRKNNTNIETDTAWISLVVLAFWREKSRLHKTPIFGNSEI